MQGVDPFDLPTGDAGYDAKFGKQGLTFDDVFKCTVMIDNMADWPKFNTIYVPYGADPDSLRIPLTEPTERRDMKLHVDRAMEVDPVSRRVGEDVLGRALRELPRPGERRRGTGSFQRP